MPLTEHVKRRVPRQTVRLGADRTPFQCVVSPVFSRPLTEEYVGEDGFRQQRAQLVHGLACRFGRCRHVGRLLAQDCVVGPVVVDRCEQLVDVVDANLHETFQPGGSSVQILALRQLSQGQSEAQLERTGGRPEAPHASEAARNCPWSGVGEQPWPAGRP